MGSDFFTEWLLSADWPDGIVAELRGCKVGPASSIELSNVHLGF